MSNQHSASFLNQALDRGKTTTPHIIGGTKTTPDILSDFSSVVHPPCVEAVIGVAPQVIAATERVKASEKDTQALICHILELLSVVSTHVKWIETDQLVDRLLT
ncbi:hypothetical protein FRB97_001897, partial [Tulasnella sp. 331]